MTKTPSPTRRFFTLALYLLGWLSLGTAAHALATSSPVSVVLGLVVSGVSFYLAVTGKVVARVREGTVTGGRILFLATIPVVVIVYEARNLDFSRVQLLGAVYVPGVIMLITAIGAILLSALMVLPLVAMLGTNAPRQGSS